MIIMLTAYRYSCKFLVEYRHTFGILAFIKESPLNYCLNVSIRPWHVLYSASVWFFQVGNSLLDENWDYLYFQDYYKCGVDHEYRKFSLVQHSYAYCKIRYSFKHGMDHFLYCFLFKTQFMSISKRSFWMDVHYVIVHSAKQIMFFLSANLEYSSIASFLIERILTRKDNSK